MDCPFILQRDSPTLPIPYTSSGAQDKASMKQQEYEYALFDIASILERQSTSNRLYTLESFNLPLPIINFNQHAGEVNRFVREELRYEHTEENASDSLNALNQGQRAAADSIIAAVSDKYSTGCLFFLNGPGGTGKTRVQNTVLAYCRARRKVVVAIASSDIAATLLEGGRTAHSRFKIPLQADYQSYCGIPKQSSLAAMLRRMELFFWDEAPIQSKYNMEAVDRLLRDICGADRPFGGKVVCFCGDFRQTLPVIPGAPPGQVIEASIRHSTFWEYIHVLHLTENMRLRDLALSEEGRDEARKFA